eukprot:CAMPEP_0182899734 /NCGR_PEP_ID=MMETSP0034_2-20130328/28263_1 /TAXON_ID=156128 /ORGANISM="Nephroselmis pyriformis, Strain CCMP717" /LENGTH=59 /DNA_ID=CAMNT_0025033787 /DNA_START=44 /DNA_END=219 /DNA_ORIENTATION=-
MASCGLSARGGQPKTGVNARHEEHACEELASVWFEPRGGGSHCVVASGAMVSGCRKTMG